MRRKPRDKNNKESGQKRGEINQLSSATKQWKEMETHSTHQSTSMELNKRERSSR